MATNRDTEYYAVTLMGKFVEAKSFQELQDKLAIQKEKDIEMYVAFMYDKPYKTQYGNTYWWPQIQIIDKEKRPISYQRGIFKVKYIYPDKGSYYFQGRRIDFENCITNQSVEKYVMPSQGMDHVTIADFYHSLRDILLELNKSACDRLIREM